MSFKCFFSVFSSGGHFVQWSKTSLAILVEVHTRNIKIFCEITLKSEHWPRRIQFKRFSIFSSGSHFVQQSGTILATYVEGYPWNISLIFFLNRAIGL